MNEGRKEERKKERRKEGRKKIVEYRACFAAKKKFLSFKWN